MQFTKLSAIVFASTVISAVAQAGPNQRLVYDDHCPGLATTHPNFGSFRTFPYIGGVSSIPNSGANAPACGSCWQLTHTVNGQSNTTYFTAINHAPSDTPFVMSFTGASQLTGYDRSSYPAFVGVAAAEVDRSFCN
ncbi:hypothetical protein BDQ17DRAFT_1428528 [Cyathus striatus]|nr:hypothetical protein BDQ17DRAFT_1428528 [Cyathus striatus]